MAKKSAKLGKVKSVHPHFRIDDADEIKLLDNLKKDTGEKTFSGAMMNAARSYFSLKNRIAVNETMIAKLQKQLLAADDVIDTVTRGKSLTESYAKQYKLGTGRLRQGRIDDLMDDED